jgi:ATP-dependent protease ClpP protease subunit
MTDAAFERLGPERFIDPAVVLAGEISYELYDSFRTQMADAPDNGLAVIVLTTLGGDPEVARMIGEDIRFLSDTCPQRRIVFLGKAAVYSAGATLMSFFARPNRYLTRGTRLMIHERQYVGSLSLDGSLSACATKLRAKLAEVEESMTIQEEGFANLIAGSSLGIDALRAKATENWYIEAQEAVELGLVEAVI